ncbi:MAG: hypothetical protein RLZZ561_1575 [Pseudomonadota bacterium]|jgi:hypothetical protein
MPGDCGCSRMRMASSSGFWPRVGAPVSRASGSPVSWTRWVAPWQTRLHRQRQRNRVYQQGNPEVGQQEPGRVALHRSRQAAAGCSFNRSLRDEHLNEELFDSLVDARRKLAAWCYGYNNVRPHSSLGNRTPAQARISNRQTLVMIAGPLGRGADQRHRPYL